MAGKKVFAVTLIQQCDKTKQEMRSVKGIAPSEFKAADAALGFCTKEERVFQVKKLFELEFEV